MALSDHTKNRYRRVIRTSMITLAVFLLVVAMAIPIANNAIALAEEKRLKNLPLPDGADLVGSVSVADNLTNVTKTMQYYGAILIRSDLRKDEISAHYNQYRERAFDCIVEDAEGARDILSTLDLSDIDAAFSADAVQDNWYLVYSWGTPPEWLTDILNLDSRV